MKIKTKDLKTYRKAYYLAHREEILKRAKAHYKRRGNVKCKGCGADISELLAFNNGHFKYCNACMEDKNKVSRQARWYRNNRFRLQIQRRKGAKK